LWGDRKEILAEDSLMKYTIGNQEIKNIEEAKNLGQISWREIILELLEKEIRAERKANRLRWRYLTIIKREEI